MFSENGCIFEKTLVVSQSVPRECKSISLYTLRPENWRKGLKVCWVHMSRRIWLSPFWPSDTIPGHSWTFHHTLIYSISFQVHYSVPFTTPSTPATLSTHHIVSSIPISPCNSSPHVPLFPVSHFYLSFTISGRLQFHSLSFFWLTNPLLLLVWLCLVISPYTLILFWYKNSYYSIARPQFVID